MCERESTTKVEGLYRVSGGLLPNVLLILSCYQSQRTPKFPGRGNTSLECGPAYGHTHTVLKDTCLYMYV